MVPGTVTLALGQAHRGGLPYRAQQATTDADGSKGFSAAVDSAVPARTQSFTYTELGQLLTVQDTEPHHNLYLLHRCGWRSCQGDLKSVKDPPTTSPRSLPTIRLAAWFPLSDPNGLVTDYFYQAWAPLCYSQGRQLWPAWRSSSRSRSSPMTRKASSRG
jgi:hypothetical protein